MVVFTLLSLFRSTAQVKFLIRTRLAVLRVSLKDACARTAFSPCLSRGCIEKALLVSFHDCGRPIFVEPRAPVVMIVASALVLRYVLKAIRKVGFKQDLLNWVMVFIV